MQSTAYALNCMHVTMATCVTLPAFSLPLAPTRPASISVPDDGEMSDKGALLSSEHLTPRGRQQQPLVFFTLSVMLVLASLLAFSSVPIYQHSSKMTHPLSALKLVEPLDENSIRYLAFGSASALGEGLEDSLQAYPYRLSPFVHNAASRVKGTSLSAICTQSIVRDRIYDVIVIEFVNEDAEGVVHLANRLRLRFPNANLVFVRLWSPATHIIYQGEMTALEWWRQQLVTFKDSDNPEPFFRSFEFEYAVLQTDPNQWTFADFSENALMIDVAISEVNGTLYNLPYPEKESAFSVLMSPRYMRMFQEAQPTLLSKAGHEMVFNGIEYLLKDEMIVDRPERNVVGSWGAGDACSMWYASGDYSTLQSRRRASLVDFSKENGLHKHAVEISRRGGSIDVTNPFDEPRMLYLTYMTGAVGASDKDREYPRTKISIGSKKTVLIDPIHELTDKGNNSDDHLPRTTAVGMVPPGSSVLSLKSLDPHSKSRFRLVGLHFLNKGKLTIPFEFALEPEPAHR